MSAPDAAGSAPGAPLFAGRRLELERLDALYEKTARGAFSIALITGESGSGKSALAQHFLARLQAREPTLLHAAGFSNPHSGQGEPYLPFRHAMHHLFEQVEDAAAPPRPLTAGRLARGVLNTVLACAPDLVSHFVPGGELLRKIGAAAVAEFAGAGHGAAPGARQELQSGKIFEQYTNMLQAVSQAQPVLLVLDDMQWCDAASADLLFHLARSLAAQRVMLVCIYRNATVALGRHGEKHPLEPVLSEIKRSFGNVWIDLDLVAAAQRAELVDALVDAEPNALAPPFRAALLAHTDGHALFACELLECLKRNGSLARDTDGRWQATAALDWHNSPEKMEGVIESRLGLLEDDLKQVLGMASVQGFHFILQVITRMQHSSERDSLQGWGKDLSKKHLLIAESKTIRIGGGMLSYFRFSSSIFQQYLYRQMGESERMLLHGEVAAILEELYRGKEQEVAFELARHYDLAWMPEQAVPWLYQAGRQAMLLSAYAEAGSQLRRAAELCAALPADAPARALECDIWLSQSQVARAVDGWNSPTAKALYQQLRPRYEASGEQDKLLEVLFGLWTVEIVGARLAVAMQIAQAMQEPARRLDDPVTEIRAAIALANTHFWLGELDAVAPLSARIRQLLPGLDRQHYLLRTDLDASAIAFQIETWSLALQGDEQGASAVCGEALAVADGLQHAFTQALAYTTAAFLHFFLDQPAAALEHSVRLIALAEQNGFASYRGLGLICRQWALVRLGESGSAAEIEQGYQLWMQHSGPLTGSFKSLLLADAHARLGRPDLAVTELQLGLAYAERTGEQPLRQRLLAQLDAVAPTRAA